MLLISEGVPLPRMARSHSCTARQGHEKARRYVFEPKWYCRCRRGAGSAARSPDTSPPPSGLPRADLHGAVAVVSVPKAKGRIPRISVFPVADFKLSDADWRILEVAYYNTLSSEVRRQIERTTTDYLRDARAENTGLMKDAIRRVKNVRKAAQSLLASIEDESGGTSAYVE
jgi:hypothetical protein